MNAAPDYRSFLEAKVKLASNDGFHVDMAEINPALKPHVRVAVRNWRVKPSPPVDQLRLRYVDERKGCPEVGRIFGASVKTVRRWLALADIPTRKRGDNPAVHFKKGELSGFAGRKLSAESRAKIGAATRARENRGFMRNGAHYLKGAPPEVNPNWRGGLTPERQTFYRSQEWKLACVAVWQRADAKCERCDADYRDADRDTERFHVHHIVSFACRELRASPDNLALLCRGCHLFVHSNANVSCEFIADAPQTAEAA